MIVTYVYADSQTEQNTSHWLCRMKANAINRTEKNEAYMIHIDEFQQDTVEAQISCTKADIIVVERIFHGGIPEAIQRWKNKGKVIVATFDDAYQIIETSNASYPYWVENKTKRVNAKGEVEDLILDPPAIKQFEIGLKLCHAITTPSKILSKDWEFCAPAYTIPNYMESENYIYTPKTQHDGIIIGWGGSLSHFQSFSRSEIVNALQKVCRIHPEVKVLIAGDERVFNLIDLPASKKIFQPFVPYNIWPQVINGFDIGIAPLCGKYDMRRSWIKIMEYMLLKVPWLASDNGAYDDLKEYGRIVRNTRKSWEVALLETINSLHECREKAETISYPFALEQDINKNVAQVLHTYFVIAKEHAGIELEF